MKNYHGGQKNLPYKTIINNNNFWSRWLWINGCMGELAKTISNWQNNIFNSANCFTPSFLRRFYEESTPGIILVSRYMHDKKSQIGIHENIFICVLMGFILFICSWINTKYWGILKYQVFCSEMVWVYCLN